MTIRTLRVAPDAILDLVKTITAGHEIVLAGESIPAEAATGVVRFDEETRTFEVDVIARWPKDVSDRGVDFKYSVRYGPELGAPRALGEPATRPTRGHAPEGAGDGA